MSQVATATGRTIASPSPSIRGSGASRHSSFPASTNVSCGECARCRRGQTGNCASVDFLSTYGRPVGPDNGGFVSDLTRVPYAEAMLVGVPDRIEPDTGRPHARTLIEPILDLIRAGSFRPELVTRETATWDDAAEAVAGHSGKLVITRE